MQLIFNWGRREQTNKINETEIWYAQMVISTMEENDVGRGYNGARESEVLKRGGQKQAR